MKLVVADSGQIEARVVAWLAGEKPLLETFRRNDSTGGDFYSDLGSTFFLKKISKKETPVERQISKNMCLAGETLVLTPRGWVPIVAVRRTDLVWDGIEWVSHLGVICQGEQQVWEANSVAATPDHGILTELGWREWQEVLTNPFLFRSALASANLPFFGGNESPRSVAITPSSNAPAVGSVMLPGRTLRTGLASDVTAAQRRQLQTHGIEQLRPPSRMTSPASDFLIELRRASPDARHQTASSLSTTARGGSACSPNGSGTAQPSLDTPPLSQVGTTRTSNSIGSTITGDTNPGTFASRQSGKICSTAAGSPTYSEGFKNSKKRTLTYDLVSAGPRHRFTILTDLGPVVAHNCLGLGFGMGWKKFGSELLKGMLGSDPVKFTAVEAEKFKVSAAEFECRPWGGGTCGEAVRDALTYGVRLSYPEALVHFAVSAHFVNVYREKVPKVPALWSIMENALAVMEPPEGGPDEIRFDAGAVKILRHALLKPNGTRLHYPGLQRGDGGYTYIGGKSGRERAKIYGGLLTENVVQSLARDIIVEQMLWIRAEGYRIGTTTHDEIVCVVPDDQAERCYEFMISRMRTPPAWCANLPLNASGGIGQSYGSVK